METYQIIILVAAAAIIILIILALVLRRKLLEKGKTKADNVEVKKGVRYTTNKYETNEDGDMVVTHRREDIILERGVTYKIEKKGKIIPGKYTILSDRDGTEAFNIRIDGFVREYKHATDIVLSEGETICAVSHSVILR